MHNKKLGFSLSGGGAKGVAHAGFLKAMEENGVKPDIITGCSIGAIVGGCYSAGVDLKTLKNRLTELTKKDLLELNFNMLKSRSVFSNKKIVSLLKKHLGDKNIEDLDVTFGCIASDLISGKIINLTDGDLVSALVASSAIPIIFQPVEKDGKLLIDGGTVLRNPVKLCKSLGADIIIGVDVIGNLQREDNLKNLLDVGMRTFSVIDGLFCGKSGTKYADLMVFPKVESLAHFKFDNLKFAYDAGYTAGINNLDKIKKLIK